MKDPRGPVRQIVKVKRPTFEDPVLIVELSCGHLPDLNPIYTYRVGDDCRCFRCGKEDKS